MIAKSSVISSNQSRMERSETDEDPFFFSFTNLCRLSPPYMQQSSRYVRTILSYPGPWEALNYESSGNLPLCTEGLKSRAPDPATASVIPQVSNEAKRMLELPSAYARHLATSKVLTLRLRALSTEPSMCPRATVFESGPACLPCLQSSMPQPALQRIAVWSARLGTESLCMVPLEGQWPVNRSNSFRIRLYNR